ncbi:hypothetical protein [Sedimenticola hydrogenitrophicus]|uniref:hypothetical protein n=1 Tax=Sedimenticola hydrogenitrophicus TaxID=2967975 RepID=UPI0023B14A6D|nr:hypothetical protein [Sedimenticola hydrogenitrophicus]
MKETVDDAEKGDISAADFLLKYAADSLKRGIPLNPDVGVWLGECLSQMIDGVEPKRAFGLSDPVGGRPPLTDDQKNQRIRIFLSMERLKRTGRAKSYTEAAAAVAADEGIEISTAEKYRKLAIKELKTDGYDPKVWAEAACRPLILPDLEKMQQTLLSTFAAVQMQSERSDKKDRD